MKKTKTTFALSLACGFAAITLIGCSSDATSYRSIAGDPTPDLQGFVERPVDVDRHLAYQTNTNWRAASDDLGRVFYTDHPSRLAPWPVSMTSGGRPPSKINRSSR